MSEPIWCYQKVRLKTREKQNSEHSKYWQYFSTVKRNKLLPP